MSAYAHQMERQFSARSLSSRDSERESRYVLESGFYMTSFAATIFIGALITVAILFITLLIALTVMLQTCENRSKGVIEVHNRYDSDSYCKNLALNAELNNVGPSNLPSICKNFTREVHFERDLKSAMRLVEEHFEGVVPSNDGLDVVLMDVDDVLPQDPQITILNQFEFSGCFAEAKQKHLKLYRQLEVRGWSMVLLSRKLEMMRNATEEYLISTGYKSWSSLIMRLEDETEMDSQVQFLKQRRMLQSKGFRVAGVVSSRMDLLTGIFAAHDNFKLPNPIYYSFDRRNEMERF